MLNFIHNKINIEILKLNSLFIIRNLFIIFFIDLLVIDDEPIWEPLEWTLVQTWILYIFLFSWIAELLVSAQYGSYTGRDKRVYNGLFKSYTYIEIWLMFNLLITCLFVLAPFYFEITYQVSYIVSWWDFFDKFFFFKFFFIIYIIKSITETIQLGLKWLKIKQILFLMFLVLFFLSFLLYSQFIVTFFSFFTDISWYKKSGWLDFINISQSPQKWGWGSEDRDLFLNHKTTLSFWFKNDSLYASGIFLINLILFFSIFFLFLKWLVLIRKVNYLNSINYTLLTFSISSINQLFYNIILLSTLMVINFFYHLQRYPIDNIYFNKNIIFLNNIKFILFNYFKLLGF